MEPQNYNNHQRFYAPHHYMFYPLLAIVTAYSIYLFIQDTENRLVIGLLIMVFIFIAWLSLMLRQHYALGNQNRIIRLEIRLRYYQLTQQRFELIETKLSFGQIAALRFATDDELPALVQRTVNENLSSDDIKKSIKNWYADHMRV